MPDRDPVNFSELVPELQEWNDGKGVTIDVWLGNHGSFKLAIAFSQLFWPKFVEHDGCILRADVSHESYDGFMKQSKGDRVTVESVMNHLHVLDLFPPHEKDATEAQIRYIGRTLKDSWSAKLARDFPGRSFQIEFNDEPNLDLLDYELTFWQAANRTGD